MKAELELAGDARRVLRFLRGLSQFRPREDDVFISSYPRSGTTWLQHITHVLATAGDVSFSHIADVVPWFERSLSLGRRRAADFEALSSPRIFKSHLPRTWLPRGARYIYAQRDGRDVAVSYYHFYRSHLGFDGDFQDFFERFARGKLQYGSWFKHVAGWRRYAGDPSILFVDYERMLSDLPSVMHEIARFCCFAIEPDTIETLIPLCGFDYMKANEARFDHATEADAARAMPTRDFIRRGAAGGHAEHMGGAQRQRFEELLRTRNHFPHLELRLAAFLL